MDKNPDGTPQLVFLEVHPTAGTSFKSPILSRPEVFSALREYPYGDELLKVTYINDTNTIKNHRTEMWFNTKPFSVVSLI